MSLKQSLKDREKKTIADLHEVGTMIKNEKTKKKKQQKKDCSRYF